MDDVREEVRAICEKVYDGASSEALWSEKGPGGEYKRDPELEMTADEATDAIMSAFKRGAGVVVKELEWEKIGGDIWRAETPTGGAYFKVLLSGSLNAGRWWHSTNTADKFDMPFDGITATVQADFAKRITSTVEPSCVVTDEMVEAACAALQADVAKRHPEAQGGWPGRIPEKDLAVARNGMRIALTAALSSRTEEEVRADEVNEAIAALVASARKCDATWKSGNPLGRWKDLRDALSRYDRAASATPPRGARSVIKDAIHKLALEADRSDLTIDRGQDAIGRPVRTKLSDWLRSPARSLTNGGK